jgi:hypothetical protein
VKGTRIALGSNPDASAGVDVLFTQDDLRPKIVDELDQYVAGAVPAASQFLSGGGLTAADRIRKGEGPPSEQMVAQRQAAQQPQQASPVGTDLDAWLNTLTPAQLREVDDKVTTKGAEQGIYAYDAFDDDEDADVGDFDNVTEDATYDAGADVDG